MKDIKDFLFEATQNKRFQPKNKQQLINEISKALNKDSNADLNFIDTSKITDMSFLFKDLDPHDIHIENWDVSNVEDMRSMFFNCYNFNCNLSNWDVSNVKDTSGMFGNCKSFKGEGLENWDVHHAKNMKYMFMNCRGLKRKPSWYNETEK